MLKIGITGGIGSGKTTVCLIMEVIGIPIYYADLRAKKIMTSNPEVKVGIMKIFGKQAFHKNHKLNRTHIASAAFGNTDLLKQLNGIVHPAVAKDYDNWCKQHDDSPYTLKEAALLVESGSYIGLDSLIVVTAPEEVRIARVLMRDKMSREAIKSRINAQMPEREKIEKAEFIVNNDGSTSLIVQALQLHKKVLLKLK